MIVKPRVVYIAVPSARVFQELDDHWQVHPNLLTILAQLHEEHPDDVFISPSIQNYQLLPFLKDSGATYEHWKNRCELLLGRCDEVLVLPFLGWQESKGVQEELATAAGLGMPTRTDWHRPEYTI